MQTNNSKPTPRVNEDAERFDEITGGYSDYEHDRAAKRIMADIRNLPQQVEGHTPGPWRIKGGMIVGDSGVNVAAASVAPSYNEMFANAHLIASAPDLLAACQRVLRAIEWGTTADRMDSTEQAELLRAAIARATNGGGM